MSQIPNLEHLVKKYRRNKKNQRSSQKEIQHVTIVVPTYNEVPDDVINTVEYCMRTNLFASREFSISEPVVDSIFLSDQSIDGSSDELEDKLSSSFEDIRSRYAQANKTHIFPQVSYIRMHDSMKHEILKEFREADELNLINSRLSEDREGLYGKGVNMYLTLILVNSLALKEKRQKKSSILYLDSEDKNRSVRQTLALSLPLSHMGNEFVKGAFSRYHRNQESGEMERGGRVNAGTKGFFDMFSKAGKLPDIGYPCCGDQGFSLRLLDEIYSPRDYGIEASVLFQLLSPTNSLNGNRPLLEGRNYTQVNIKGSDDAPIGEGKPKEEILRGISNMAGQVVEGALGVIGYDNLLQEWPTYEEFMESFDEFQWDAMEHYRHRSAVDNEGIVLKISGDITDEELTLETYRSVSEIVKKLYEGQDMHQKELVRNNLIPNRVLRDSLREDYHKLAQIIKDNSVQFDRRYICPRQ